MKERNTQQAQNEKHDSETGCKEETTYQELFKPLKALYIKLTFTDAITVF